MNIAISYALNISFVRGRRISIKFMDLVREKGSRVESLMIDLILI